MELNVLRSGEGRAYWVAGDRNTVLATGEDTGGAYALFHTVVPPSGGPPPHVHRREDETFYVLEGELTFHADGRIIPAAPGTWVTLPRGSQHSFRNNGAAAARVLIVASPSGLEKFFAEAGREAVDGESQPPVTPADIERLVAVAPKYGIEIEPPGAG